MSVAILSVGDHLLQGEIVDRSAPLIAARLDDLGLPVARHLTVGDDVAAIEAALTHLAAGHDAVIVTGGLGPDAADVTARAAAKAAGRRLVVHEEALAHLRHGRPIPGGGSGPLSEKQALLPAKATLIPNPLGTACGFLLQLGTCLVAFLPGATAELKPMLEETLLPLLARELPPRRVVVSRRLRVFGLTEAEVLLRVRSLPLPAGVTVACGAAFPETAVKVRGSGEDRSLVTEAVEQAAGQLRQLLQEYVVAGDGESLDATVAALFRAKGVTLALAESCTGGLLAKRITDLAGSSAYFLEGVVTYSNAAKERLLGVPPSLLAVHGAVSREVAMAMARGARSRAGSDLGLAITGIAGPDGGTPEKPVGTVFLALADRSGCQACGYRFAGSREEIREISAHTALDWLRRKLLTINDTQVQP